ncbi:UNVERIFIED_CONTAM: hypothetical protein Slati_4521900 [Sesamum latifolium]|uniref:Uncharacterized protein n=1 Tax=Sesamum latifolium TaxID=2727402 RepID=A0AAW2SGH4_9LAMI
MTGKKSEEFFPLLISRVTSYLDLFKAIHLKELWTKKLPRDELLADFVLPVSTPALVMWLQLTESIQRS